MHPSVFAVFDEICRVRQVRGAVLEVGATPDESTLLNLPSLAGVAEKVGLNLGNACRYKDIAIVQGNANTMTGFADARFDAVLCNSVLEHDPFFWKTLAEIRRVTRVGGLIAIGAPGYARLPLEGRLRALLAKLPRARRNPDGWALQHSTLTLGVHNFPNDYYRFTEATFRDVFFAGMVDVQIRTILVPPRIIGAGSL